MKKITLTAGVGLLSLAAIFSSCNNEVMEELDEIKANQEAPVPSPYVQSANARLNVSGNYYEDNLRGVTYDESFSFTYQNLDPENLNSNVVTATRYKGEEPTGINTSEEYDYTVQSFNITIYQFDGYNMPDELTANGSLTIRFDYYTGDLRESSTYEADEPVNVRISYDVTKTTQGRNDITNFTGTASEDNDEWDASISNYDYNENTGDISFSYSGTVRSTYEFTSNDIPTDEDTDIDGSVKAAVRDVVGTEVVNNNFTF